MWGSLEGKDVASHSHFYFYAHNEAWKTALINNKGPRMTVQVWQFSVVFAKTAETSTDENTMIKICKMFEVWANEVTNLCRTERVFR